ncbi:MAG TPA: universal stress protein [Acidobacteriota bacterium]|nr:universal stress protein [Acidobacteriota bacterium]
MLEEAANWNADIVVVGTRGWSGIDRIRLGSVSDAIAIHAPCSVEIVRHCTLSE